MITRKDRLTFVLDKKKDRDVAPHSKIHLGSFRNFEPRPGSVIFERLPGMGEVGGSILGRVKQKTLKLRFCCSAQRSAERS